MASWQPWRCYLARKKMTEETRFVYRHDVDFYFILFFLCSTFDAILKSWITSGVHVRCDFFFSFFLTCCCLFPSSFYAPGAPVALPRRARFHRVFNCFLFSPFGWYPVLSSFSLFLLSDCTTTIHVNNVHLTSIPSLPVEQSHTYCDVRFSYSARDVPVANSILYCTVQRRNKRHYINCNVIFFPPFFLSPCVC